VKNHKLKLGLLGVLAASLACGVLLAGCNGSSSGGAVATVNGEAVSREELRDHLEATNGESALRQLIDYALVMQKAKAEGITVSDAEVSAGIDERAKTTPDIAQVVQAGGVRLQALQRQTRYQIALDKLLTKDVKATDDQVKKWFESRRKYYDRPEKVRFGYVLSSTKARADTMAAQLKNKSKSFQELVTAQQSANDQLAKGSQAESPRSVNADSLPPAIKAAVAKLKPGETSGVLPLGQAPHQAYVVVRLIEREPAVKADFAKMKDEATTDYKLEQVAKKLNAENPQNPPFDRTLEQVASVVSQQNGGQTPSLREILSFINQTAASNLTNGLRTAANVEIKDPSYAKVGEEYKPVPGAASTPAAGATPAATPKP
jgi:foldase protein PrsA